MLRLRSDEQLVALFRAGNEEAFRVIHDRYKTRLFAYTRQMLPGSRQDAEDALQDVFVRAYQGLRASDRELSLRAWLYRVAHNRCIDELRRPVPPAPEVLGSLRSPVNDPTVEAEQRESLRRLIEDVRRLPNQQRSALLMRELGGMPYSDVSGALGVSVPAVKSLLVRARMGLAQALEARDTACSAIREELAVAHDRGVRPSGLARRHMHDCAGCRDFRGEMRGASRQLAALVPIGPLGVIANLLGIGGGGGAAAAGSGAGVAAGGAAGTGGAVAGGVGALAGVSHVATLLAAAVVTAGGAVELQRTIAGPSHHARHHLRAAADRTTDAPIVPITADTATAGPLSYRPRVPQAPAAPRSHSMAPSGASTIRPPTTPATTSTGSATSTQAPSGNFNTTGAINEETGASATGVCASTTATASTASTSEAVTANSATAAAPTASGTATGACPATSTTCTTAASTATSPSTCTASTTTSTTSTGTSTQGGSATQTGGSSSTGTTGTKGTGAGTGTSGTTGSSPTATASSASGSPTSSASTGSSGSTGSSTSSSTAVRLHL